MSSEALITRMKCAKSPNDPKLSDRGVRRGTCMAGGKAAAEAGAVTHGAVRCSAWLGDGWIWSERHICIRTEPQSSYAAWLGVSPYGLDGLSRTKSAILADPLARSRKWGSEPGLRCRVGAADSRSLTPPGSVRRHRSFRPSSARHPEPVHQNTRQT